MRSLDSLRDAWDGDWVEAIFVWSDLGNRVPGVGFRHEIDLRVQSVFPLDLFATVNGHAAHDGRQSAVSSVLAFVIRRVVTNGGEQVVMLGLVRIVFGGFATVFPGVCSRDFCSADVGVTFASVSMLGDAVLATSDVSALTEHLSAVVVGVFDGEVVEDFSVLLVGTNLATAHSLAFDGVAVAFYPVTDVEVVDVLLADVVAAQPCVVVPVAKLVFHFAADLIAGLARIPDASTVPVATHGDDIADLAVPDSFHCFEVRLLVMSLQADTDFQVFLFGDLNGFQDLANTWRVCGDGFFHEDVLAGSDSSFDMDRAEAWWRCQDDEINFRHRHDFFVGVETCELVILVDSYPVAVRLLESWKLGVDVVLKGVGDGDQLDRASSAQCLIRRYGSTSACTDKGNSNGVVISGERATWECKAGEGAGSCSGGSG